MILRELRDEVYKYAHYLLYQNSVADKFYTNKKLT